MNKITFVKDQNLQVSTKSTTPNSLFLTLGLSRKGFSAFGVPDQYVVKDESGLFDGPMFGSVSKSMVWLYENDDFKSVEEDYLVEKPIHVLMYLACNLKEKLSAAVELIRVSLSEFEIKAQLIIEDCVRTGQQRGSLLGFIDGVSNAVHESDIEEVAVRKSGSHDFIYGSFLSIQKILTSDLQFRKLVHKLAKKILMPKSNKRLFNRYEIAEAMLMGRFRDGTPINQLSEDRHLIEIRNFNHLMVGGKNEVSEAVCPYHSHIRAVNSRNRDVSDDKQFSKIIRRGMEYFHPLDKGQEEGLFFMSYQKSLGFLSEIMRDMQSVNKFDAVMYREKVKDISLKFHRQLGNDDSEIIEIDRSKFEITKLRGGENFFMMSLPYLEFVANL